MKLYRVNLRIQLILILAGVFLFGEFIPDPLKSFFYTISISFRSILLFAVPFIILIFSLGILIENEEKAIQFMSMLVLFVCLSYFFAIMLSYATNLDMVMYFEHWFSSKPSMETVELLPLWRLELEPVLTSEAALLVGLLLGLFFSFWRPPQIIAVIKYSNKMMMYLMGVLLIRLLPLFVFGFILKLNCQGILGSVFEMYFPILGMVLIINIIYMLLILGIQRKFIFLRMPEIYVHKLFFQFFKVMPLLSLAVMPASLETFEKKKKMALQQNTNLLLNMQRYPTNKHMLRDCFCLPIIMIIMIFVFDIAMPGFAQYMNFTQFYMITRFIMPTVPSASLFVFLPGFENYLGFTPEMAAFIMAFYILLDPVITIENILGRNGPIMFFTKRFSGPKIKSKFFNF